MDIKSQKVGKIIHSLHMTTVKKRYSGKQQHYIVWDPTTMRKIHRRYITDKSEFASLFESELDPEVPADDLDLEV